MVFKELVEVWKKKNLLNQALDNIRLLFKNDTLMFKEATAGLFEGKKLTIDIYKEDQTINQLEMDNRKKIIEHLTINPRQDTPASLLLLEVSRDLERVGDYCKNIYELSYLNKKPLEGGSYVTQLIKTSQQIEEMFSLTNKAFEQDDPDSAKKVIDLHRNDIGEKLNIMIDRIINDKKIDSRKAVVCALACRFLKRISAHLMGISSSVTNPFDKIRHTAEDNTILEKKNIPAWKLPK
ncbi:hypothetical protein GOV09_03155 [Candidatus Woesearchaeota archaeon]|nr:hypothetical protein [Candidatus Woesearchaeota archaeon]